MSDSGQDYPEDWQEQGWCCRECAVMAWYSMSPELRSLFVPATGGKNGSDEGGAA